MPTPVITKKCSKCKLHKELSEFHKNKKRPDGLQYVCKKCAIEAIRIWQRENKDKVAERNKRWKLRHPEQVSESARRYHASLPPKTSEYHRAIALKRRGLTIPQYEDLLEKQGGLCAICGLPNRHTREFAVDHDHQCCKGRDACSKCRRGLLCIQCNTALHAMENDSGWHLKALAYLSRYSLQKPT